MEPEHDLQKGPGPSFSGSHLRFYLRRNIMPLEVGSNFRSFSIQQIDIDIPKTHRKPWNFDILSWLVTNKVWCNSWEIFGRRGIYAMWCWRVWMVYSIRPIEMCFLLPVQLSKLCCVHLSEKWNRYSQGKPVEMAASGGVVSAFLDYLYGGEPEVATMDAVEVLRLAGAYGLPLLAASVESDLRASLTSQLALQLLPEALVVGLHELQQACEEQIACDFQQCVLQEDFQKLSAKQLQRILQREDLNVSREELVVEALFRWSKSSQDKKRDMVLLLANVDFPSLSTSNLALSAPCCSIFRLWGSSFGVWDKGSDGHPQQAFSLGRCVYTSAKATVSCTLVRRFGSRQRKQSWWNQGDTDMSTEAAGDWCGIGVHSCLLTICREKRSASLQFALQRLEFRIVACKPGDKSFQIVAGQGARVNGVNQLRFGCPRTCSFTGWWGVLWYLPPTAEQERNCWASTMEWVRFCSKGWSSLGQLCGSPTGVLYLVDKRGEKVQKMEGSAWTPLLSRGQLPEDQQEPFESIFASGQETLYIVQGARILRLLAGASVPTVVADCGPADKTRLRVLCDRRWEDLHLWSWQKGLDGTSRRGKLESSVATFQMVTNALFAMFLSSAKCCTSY